VGRCGDVAGRRVGGRVVSTPNEGSGTSSRRGRWVGGRSVSFQRKMRAVRRRGDVAGRRVGGGGRFNAKRGRWGRRGDVAGGRVGGGGRFNTKRGWWDVAGGWVAGGGRFNAKRGGRTSSRRGEWVRVVDVVVTWQVGSHRRAKRRLVAVGGSRSMCGWGGDGRGLGQRLFTTEEGGEGAYLLFPVVVRRLWWKRIKRYK